MQLFLNVNAETVFWFPIGKTKTIAFYCVCVRAHTHTHSCAHMFAHQDTHGKERKILKKLAVYFHHLDSGDQPQMPLSINTSH